MDDLVTWLLEQIAKDERAADEMRSNADSMSDCGEAHDESIELLGGWTFDADRLLADCDAKRKLLALHEHKPGAARNPYSEESATFGCVSCHFDHDYEENYNAGWCEHVRIIALAFAHRDGYREEWRP
jgi:hypothetical protein